MQTRGTNTFSELGSSNPQLSCASHLDCSTKYHCCEAPAGIVSSFLLSWKYLSELGKGQTAISHPANLCSEHEQSYSQFIPAEDLALKLGLQWLSQVRSVNEHCSHKCQEGTSTIELASNMKYPQHPAPVSVLVVVTSQGQGHREGSQANPTLLKFRSHFNKTSTSSPGQLYIHKAYLGGFSGTSGENQEEQQDKVYNIPLHS